MKQILVTNDDGIVSAGIKTLADAVSGLGEVTVIAPDREMSAISHAITLGKSLRVEETAPGWYAVSGTPTDCVYLGFVKIMDGNVDLVVSGLNHGANLGEDVHYSGTVAGAVEGSILGAPAVAFSQIPGLTVSLDEAAEFVRTLAGEVLSGGLAPRTFLNVNFPPPPSKGVKLTRLGRHIYEQAVTEQEGRHGERYYWIGGNAVHHEQSPDTDVQAVHDGYISVTPMHIDMTDENASAELADWKLFGGGR
jgi:5'-nucleotidase